MNRYDILSIDAWGNNEDGFDWNSWHKVGEAYECSKESALDSAVESGLISGEYVGDYYVGDDGYNIVIYSKESPSPIVCNCIWQCG